MSKNPTAKALQLWDRVPDQYDPTKSSTTVNKTALTARGIGPQEYYDMGPIKRATLRQTIDPRLKPVENNIFTFASDFGNAVVDRTSELSSGVFEGAKKTVLIVGSLATLAALIVYAPTIKRVLGSK